MSKNKRLKQQPEGKRNLIHSTINQKNNRWENYGLLFLILLISFIVYLPTLQNGFVWDDELYVTSNKLIHTFNLKEIFSKNVAGNYHPVTIFIFAIEYYFFGLNGAGYHIVNLLIHLLNVVLVFYAVFLLSEKAVIALIASLLFGIHPLHVESVAWISELKDLLYTFFFLASFIFYLKFIKNGQKKFYVYAILLFFVSLLSKAMAASLPVVLLLADYFKGRKFTLKTILEKVPFFFFAIIFGLVAVSAQKTAGATDMVVLPFPQRVVFAIYGFISYLYKIIVPLDLSAFYPYPMKTGESIPAVYYIYVILFLLLSGFLIYSIRYSRKLIFGFGFFTITVFLVLQLLPVGGAVMADRYSYLPSVGIFYLTGEAMFLLWSKNRKVIAIGLVGIFTVFFSVNTSARCRVWKDEMSLWNNVIEQYQTVPLAYYNRGSVFMNEKKYNEAYEDFSKTIELNPDHYKAYINRGSVLCSIGRNDEGLNNFNKAIELNPRNAKAYNNRGIYFMSEKKYSEALNDYNKAIELDPDFVDVYSNRGIVLAESGRLEEAIRDFSKSIELKPNSAAYLNRAFVFNDLNNYNDALNDFNKSIEMNPGNPVAFFNRGILFMKQQKYNEAIFNFTRTTELKLDYATAYFQRGLAYYYKGEKEVACNDFKQAVGLGYQPAKEAIMQICN